MPTYPDGFPDEVVELIATASGRGILCNRPYNGIEAIEHFGGRARAGAGKLIVYTSQDSVLQIAAHVDLVPTEELYEICRQVRAGLSAEHQVGRVIARPFAGATGAFERTDGRRDYALAPTGAQLSGRASRLRRPGSHRGQGRAAVRGRRDRRAASRRHQPPGVGGDGRAAALARRGLRVHEPRSRPIRSTDTATTSRAFTVRCREIDAHVARVAGAAQARRYARADRRSRMRRHRVAHRSHPRARAAAGPLRRRADRAATTGRSPTLARAP